MKEITVTFENGGVFNGSANSFTLDNLITYYFTIDKNYRVQINADTMAIELQEYQNTNGAWYGIDIITAVSVQDAQGEVTKAYLEANYYNKAEVDSKISAIPSSDVTKEYLEQNYYSKAQIEQIVGRYYTKDETDQRYVRKAGDTMTGPLIITNSEGYKAQFEANSWTIYNTEGAATLNLYNNNVNLYNSGGVYIKQGSTGSASIIRMTVNGFYIYDPDGEWVGSLAQENNYAICALHMFNNSRIAMHSGKPNTTERFLQINGSEFYLYNNVDDGSFRFHGPMVIDRTLSVQSVFTAHSAAYFEGQANFNGHVSVNDGFTAYSRFNIRGSANFYAGLTLNGNAGLRVGDTTNYVYISQSGMFVYDTGKLVLRADTSRGLELFNSHAIIVHNDYNITGKHTAYNWNGINTYNMTSGADAFNLYLNNNNLYIHCYRFAVYGHGIVDLFSSISDVTMHGSESWISANNTPKATNDQFLALNFLNALNLFLQRMQDNIRAQSPAYQVVSEIIFSKENFGGGFRAGGGSSRGGGVGRRT